MSRVPQPCSGESPCLAKPSSASARSRSRRTADRRARRGTEPAPFERLTARRASGRGSSRAPKGSTIPSTAGRIHEPATSAAVPPIDAPTSFTRVAPSARSLATAGCDIEVEPVRAAGRREAVPAEVDRDGSVAEAGKLAREGHELAVVAEVLVPEHDAGRAGPDLEAVDRHTVPRLHVHRRVARLQALVCFGRRRSADAAEDEEVREGRERGMRSRRFTLPS